MCMCGCLQLIGRYQDLWQEIMKLDNIQHYDAIYLDCEDLKHSLASATHQLSQMLLDKVAEEHRKENQRYILYSVSVPV